ncbi:MAG: MFS transporter, partial [Actinomycetota bacterium]
RASGEAGKRESGDTGENITGPLPVIVDNRVAAIVRRPIVWMLFAAFGMQSAIYYGMSTWLPTMLIDTTGTDAATAGALASLFQGVAIVGALLAPVLLKYLGAVPAGVLMGACFGTMVIGMLFAPEVAAVWASFGAIAHSSGFVLIFTAMVRVSRSDAEAATMSALVQGGGYVLAALGAPLLGALNEISGGWQAPMLAVIAATVVYSTALVSAMFVALRRG